MFDFKKFFINVYRKVILLNDSPHNIAGGLAIGIFFGILPALGPVTALVIAHFFRVNRRAAFLGGLVTNTWISLLTFVLAARIGAKVTGQEWQEIYQQCKEILTDFKWGELFNVSTLEIIKPLFAGYAVVGFVLAVTTYFAVWITLNKRHARKKISIMVAGCGLTVFMPVVVFAVGHDRGCFFKSDCPTGKKCVMAKGQARGICVSDPSQPQTSITEIGKDPVYVSCRYHSECAEGEMCVKDQEGVGKCQSDPLAQEYSGQKSGALPVQEDETRCSFNTDCKTGSICEKDFGQMTGTCKEPSILEEDKNGKKDKSIFDKIRKRQQCLMDSDCGLNGVCMTVKGSVFGECRDKKNPDQLFAP